MILKTAMELVEARSASARLEKDVYYHGTTRDLYPVIRKQGLIPDPKKRAWSDDKDRSPSTFDRTSYGGIYVTRNLMTAMSSAGIHARRSKNQNKLGIIVIMELQPRTLFLDEDELLFSVGNVHLEGAASSEQVRFWLYIEWKYGDGDSDKSVRSSKKQYADDLVDFARKTTGSVDKNLEQRLRELAPGLWEASVTRVTAYYPNVHGQWWKSSWKNEVRNYAPSYEWDDPSFPMPPEPSKAEADFRKAFEQLTRTLKDAARPTLNKRSFSHNARLTTPVGYSGENKIIAIIEELPDFKYRVLWGNVPEDFKKQWKERIGSDPDAAIVREGAVIDLPKLSQSYEYDCGAAVLRSLARLRGIKADQEEFIDILRPSKVIGTDTDKLVDAIDALGIGNRIMPDDADVNDLLHQIDKGKPVVMTVLAYDGGHWVIAVGRSGKRVYFIDPKQKHQFGYIPLEELDRRWRTFDEKDRKRAGIVITSKAKKDEANWRRAEYIPEDDK
jgi:hypothetical protein